ncbi:MAG: hypothetical protein Q8M76_14755 [Spirochaetaceae bacterium]|nr:hypothetical protein [Spirochaetaceae bacterium]
MKSVEARADDLMQSGYVYLRTEEPGKAFHRGFAPELRPDELLALGVFGGKYMTDCSAEFPEHWYERAKLCHEAHRPELNYFLVNASKPLSYWRAKLWIRPEDPRGWFQWYCRYFMGRRGPDDERQIARWKAMTRHIAQIRAHCQEGDLLCRSRQRQALLHWAYDSRRI